MKSVKTILLLIIFVLIVNSCSFRTLTRNRSLEKFLKSQHFEYSIDDEGDYQIFSDKKNLPGDVWIRGKINFSGTVGIREIFAFSPLLGESELNQVSRVLLLDNAQTRVMGSWSVLRDAGSGKYLILYIVKAPLYANKDFILQAVKETSEAVVVLEKVLFPEP